MPRFMNPALLIACAALAVALSGTAYAVTKLPRNSVGTRQVINHSLQRVDLKRGVLPAAAKPLQLTEAFSTLSVVKATTEPST